MNVSSGSGVQPIADIEWRKRQMRLLHEAMKVLVGSLCKGQPRAFLVKIWKLVEWKCVTLLVSFNCEILKQETFQWCVAVLHCTTLCKMYGDCR